MVAHFFGLAAFGVIMRTPPLILALGNAGGAFISGSTCDLMGGHHYAMLAYMRLYVLAWEDAPGPAPAHGRMAPDGH